MIIVSYLILFIEILHLGLLKLTSKRLKMQISKLILPTPNLNQAKTLYSTANSKVEIYQLLFRVSENQFDIYMKVDTNTNGHRQWFYFSVQNNKKSSIKLNIFRFKKKYSLFQRGMKPYARSIKSQSSWQPCGTNISYRYEKRNTDILQVKQKRTYYLTFKYNFEQEKDEVYFCCGIPYTYTHLQKRLRYFKQTAQKLDLVERGQIKFQIDESNKTLCGLQLPVLTIQSNTHEEKKYLIINARTHPGESSSSWVLDGFIQKILASEEVLQWIIKNQISFKIIPMLNPDGVFLGNYRTGVVGDDFNRKFCSGKKQFFPEINTVKTIVSSCKKNGVVYLFLDIHGHSILKNSFLYGPMQTLFINNPLRKLPYQMVHASQFFRLSSCKFRFEKQMSQTARVYFQIKQNILSYTSETSLGLYCKNGTTCQMLQKDYQLLGGSIVKSISELLIESQIKIIQRIIPPIRVQTISNVSNKFNLQAQNIMMNYHKNKINDIDQPESGDKKKFGNFDRTANYFHKTAIQNKINIEQRQLPRNSVYIERNKTNSMHKQEKSITKQYIHSFQQTNIKQKKSISQIKSCAIQKFYDKINESTKMKKIEKINQMEDHYNRITHHQIQQINRSTSNQEKQVKISIKKSVVTKNESKFKIRKRSDMIKAMPQSFRKKLGTKIFMPLKSIKHLASEQEQFVFERSVTSDSAYLNSQFRQIQEISQNRLNKKPHVNQDDGQNLQIINEQVFSEQYDSINDSDSSSDDLESKKKQYVIECIKNNRRFKTNCNLANDEKDNNNKEDNQWSANNLNSNINRFKQIQFKSLQSKNKHQLITIRQSKRQPNKLKQINNKSLGRNIREDYEPERMINMVQRKQLNERAYRKTQRQPYFLVQIKNKPV